MANVITSAQDIPSPIAERLRGLRRKLTAWICVDGSAYVLLATLGIFALDLVIDWYFRLDRAQRGVLWLLMVGAILVLIYRRLLVPLASHVNDDALILEVEKRHKDLGQSVISAAQFSRVPDIEQLGMSRSMVDATIRHGSEQATRINFGDVLDRPGWWKNLLLLLLGLGLAIGLGAGIAQGGPLQIWFQRNLLLSDATWPQKTYLVIEGLKDGVVTLPRGESWTQLVSVREDSLEIPDNVYIDFYPTRGRPTQTMKQTGERNFETVFNNVIEEFQFRARGGDELTPYVKVRLVEPPAVNELEMVTTRPQYAGGVEETLASGKGPYYVLPATSLTIRGTANKPLSKVVLVIEPDLPALARKIEFRAEKPVEEVDDENSEEQSASTPSGFMEILDSEIRLELSLSGSINFVGQLPPWQPEPGKLDKLVNDLQANPRLVPGKYRLELTDAGGLTSKRPTTFVMGLKDDREPRFSDARLVGVSMNVVPKARIPYSAKVADDFALSNVQLRYRWRAETSDAHNSGAEAIASVASQLPAEQLKIDDSFELSKLKLEPGSSLTLFLEATDNDAVNIGGPKTGKSPDFALRIVTEEQLRADLLRREKEQRQEFERLLTNQTELTTDLAALAADVAGQPDFTDEQRLTLMALQKRQNLIATNTTGVANVLESITIEVINNRLEEEGGKLESRLREKIIAPMRKIASVDVDEAVMLLERARRVAGNAAERDQALAQTQEQQKAIADTMRLILAHMEKAEGYQEAINLIYELEKAQKDVLNRTLKERDDRIKRIFGGGSSEKPEDDKSEEDKPKEGDAPAPAPEETKPE